MKIQYVFFLSSTRTLFRSETDLSNRFIETHNKSLTNAVSLFISIGGWFLWNIILAFQYKPETKIYYVRRSFVSTFGDSLTWWLCTILIVATVLVFEIGVQSVKKSFWPSDEDVFQALEKDPGVKRRFEEAASGELQQGWDRKTNKEKDEEEKIKRVVSELQRNEEDRREGEVKEMLRNRAQEVDSSEGRPGARPAETSDSERNREDVDLILSKGYGRVRA
jgi:phospholipid-translocating ATPase